jgi:phosphate:Na+ symporter
VSNINVIAIGSLVGFFGFVLMLQKNQVLKSVGKAALGFGFLFMGIDLLTKVVESFKCYSWFTGLFLVKNPLLLLLNGFIITAILQSSSVVTSVMLVLAELGLLSFKNAVFIVLGANVGTCLPVVFTALSMGKESIKCSIFNVTFNIIGCALFMLPLIFFGDAIQSLKIFSFSQARAIANFHTLFNVSICIVLLPFLKPVCKMVEKFTEFLMEDDCVKKKNKEKIFIKYALKRNNN